MFVFPNHPVTRAFRDLKERGIRLRFLLPHVIDIKELKVQITQEEGKSLKAFINRIFLCPGNFFV